MNNTDLFGITVESLIVHMASGALHYVPQNEVELCRFKEHALRMYRTDALFNRNVQCCADEIVRNIKEYYRVTPHQKGA